MTHYDFDHLKIEGSGPSVSVLSPRGALITTIPPTEGAASEVDGAHLRPYAELNPLPGEGYCVGGPVQQERCPVHWRIDGRLQVPGFHDPCRMRGRATSGSNTVWTFEYVRPRFVYFADENRITSPV